jgi:hypothetical protein
MVIWILLFGGVMALAFSLTTFLESKRGVK